MSPFTSSGPGMVYVIASKATKRTVVSLGLCLLLWKVKVGMDPFDKDAAMYFGLCRQTISLGHS